MEKKKLSTKWKVVIVIGCILLALILVGVGAMLWITNGLSKYKKMPIGKIDLSKVEDGTYTGSFNGGRWSNTLSVTVKGHRITGLKVVKDVQFKLPEKMKLLFDRVLDAQTLQVDTVTGSTVTSKAYLKSIENALSGTR